MHAVVPRRVALVAVCSLALVLRALGGERPAGLEFREIAKRGIAETGTAIPGDAVQVFVYEGACAGMRVTEKLIAVNYRRSGVLFDRASGKPVKRLTVADRWPEVRPDAFAPFSDGSRLAGPGVNVVYRRPTDRPEPVIVASVTFDGHAWRAVQPSGFLSDLSGLSRGLSWKERREKFGAWTPILRKLNPECYVEAAPREGGQPRRFTMADGLASNIVTHLAVAGGVLWAACVDVYEPERNQWGPGGLCRFDPATSRWQRVGEINGRPVRWVTLLETVGDELWVGFLEGSGVAGNEVGYGMGVFPQLYRPVAKALVLARLANGRWRSFDRAPRTDPPRAWSPEPKAKEPPTEKPCRLGRSGDRVVLFSRTRGRRPSWNWRRQLDGHVSLLDLKSGRWRAFDLYKDFDADVLDDMLAEQGEILVTSNRGVHRWDAAAGSWRFLDPGGALRNPALSAATPVGDELWVGYSNQSFGVIGRQGISRLNEKTGKWTHVLPKELGTSCPIRRIAALPDGEVWVLFRQWRSRTAAMEFPYYPREEWQPPSGVGRFSGGKWTFPVELEGVPRSASRKVYPPAREGKPAREGRRFYVEPTSVADIAALGNRLFVATPSGVYVGPEPWKRIVSQPATRLRASEDGKSLLIACTHPQTPRTGQPTTARYDPGSGKVLFGVTRVSDEERRHLSGGGTLLTGHAADRWIWQWVRVPTSKPGQWAVGPMLWHDSHRYVETPSAVWIASQGELIRLDRKRLAAWLAE